MQQQLPSEDDVSQQTNFCLPNIHGNNVPINRLLFTPNEVASVYPNFNDNNQTNQYASPNFGGNRGSIYQSSFPIMSQRPLYQSTFSSNINAMRNSRRSFPRTDNHTQVVNNEINWYRFVSYCVFFLLTLYKFYDLISKNILNPKPGASFATDLFLLSLLLFLCIISKPNK